MTLDLQSEWAELLLDRLHAAGVREVVLSPGSRSTPFVLAARRVAGLVLHDVIDERSAAFFALGLGRATGRPPLLLCTSGTAGAHHLPALIEAGLQGVPLLVLTADRPLELQDCGAPQTIDQVKLFGAAVRTYVELGAPDAAPGAIEALGRIAAQAVARALGPDPGPVHLNARARKPLEPTTPASESERAAAARARAERVRAVPRLFHARSAPAPEGIAELARRCEGARRGLIVCGPAPLAQAEGREAVAQLAARTGFPLLAEATSQLRFGLPSAAVPVCDGFDALLALPGFRRAHRPDLVLQLGAPPASEGYARLLDEDPGLERAVIAARGWPDPQGHAAILLHADPAEAAAALAARLGPPPPERAAWAERLVKASRLAHRAIEGALAAAREDGRLEEAEVALAAVRAVPPGGALVLGNSLPLRQVERHCPGAVAACEVVSQRGANGIDGLVSGAAGVAATGRPVVLLVGDVSLAHDLGGLWIAARTRAPLAVVVVQNGGGRIFERLPLGSAPELAAALPHFTTPPGLELSHAAGLFGISVQRATDVVMLERALASALERPGCTLVEAVVPADGGRAFDAGLMAELEAALARAGLLPGDAP